MARIEKTVFISYRRDTGAAWALAISQNLTHNGYDVFLDYGGIASGDFEQIIIENIRARAHFLVLLTPSALERVNEPGDWLRREIEAAIEHRRNIVPLMLEGLDYATPSISRYLAGTLAALKAYNGLSVPVEYFHAAMDKLRSQRLNVTIDAVLHPPSSAANEAAVNAQLAAAKSGLPVDERELAAERWFERGIDATARETKLHYYTEAIRLKPDFVEALNNRALCRREVGDLKGALADYDEAVRIAPDASQLYYNRGGARRESGDLDGALADYNTAIRLNPHDSEAFNNRGAARWQQGKLADALADYDQAVRLSPNRAEPYYNRANARAEVGDWRNALADYDEAIKRNATDWLSYYNRGTLRADKGDLKGALADYDEALRLRPQEPSTYFNRAVARTQAGRYADAIKDYRRYLDLGGGELDGDQTEVEKTIRQLNAKRASEKRRSH